MIVKWLNLVNWLTNITNSNDSDVVSGKKIEEVITSVNFMGKKYLPTNNSIQKRFLLWSLTFYNIFICLKT